VMRVGRDVDPLIVWVLPSELFAHPHDIL
jgi:hypothetical protein